MPVIASAKHLPTVRGWMLYLPMQMVPMKNSTGRIIRMAALIRSLLFFLFVCLRVSVCSILISAPALRNNILLLSTVCRDSCNMRFHSHAVWVCPSNFPSLPPRKPPSFPERRSPTPASAPMMPHPVPPYSCRMVPPISCARS